MNGDRQMLQKTMTILWPSFLAAIVAEGFFFSFLSPQGLSVASGLELSAAAIYSIGFFCFWGFTTLASLMTWYLSASFNG
jgi:hypothetical protein